ncbi:glycosyltransferase family 2 protein [uncultured Rikenella sp.]|uniref:glycosyltransferase family 2 protein n=1 Tax=uncultured Rikenella sp. TaxID=368003 RepID=UPI00260BA117|nr:glycosyltransferase family 2 protein [uncultured Rikenella sp.]
MELVSIVMPVYNGEQYVRATIDSVLSQSYSDWELICVNDSSPDGSLAILERYASVDPRIKVYTTPNGGSASKATHFGIGKIAPESKYYFYLSQDDLLSADLLEKCVVRARETGAQAVMPDMEWYYEDQSFVKPANRQDYIGYQGDRRVIIDGRTAFRGSIEYQVPGFFMVETQIVRQVGFYDFSYNSIDATGKLWLLHCVKVAFCDGRFFYRQDNDGAITKKISLQLFDALQTNDWLYSYIDQNFRSDRELLGYVKRLQLDDLVSRYGWLCDKNTLEPVKYRQAVERTKAAYARFRAQGGYMGQGGMKERLKALLINTSYATFGLYAKRANGK